MRVAAHVLNVRRRRAINLLTVHYSLFAIPSTHVRVYGAWNSIFPCPSYISRIPMPSLFVRITTNGHFFASPTANRPLDVASELITATVSS